MKEKWRRTPAKIRRPIVLIVGGFFVILSGLTGWLPGPGGIPLFLIGITILASEFVWAERFRDWVLGYIFAAGKLIRRYWAGLLVATIGLLVILGLWLKAYV